MPDDAPGTWREAVDRGAGRRPIGSELLSGYRTRSAGPGGEFERGWPASCPTAGTRRLPVLAPATGALATRQASRPVLNALAGALPEPGRRLGRPGAAAPGPRIKGGGDFGPTSAGRNIHWGVREHGMAAGLNGMAAHGGLRPFGSTFLVFSDYMKPSHPPGRDHAAAGDPASVPHDSIGLGEDGPTHQPIEQLAMLRAIPNVVVLRPADATETVEAWRAAMERTDGPTALVLTRQKLPMLDRAQLRPPAGVRRGAYVLLEPPGGRRRRS